ncbi:hypothetical protein KM803_15200 [Clostridium tyrobutyricum]|uniref:hypothetical protein n=1 Tax=Clostridium tyrobutyricum TaxID=1519 RepID=UPI001C390861|nr:hypothetical protein [Clostridium tyrobutyricum]MBV4432651.1 hypothetical protein [Clostridium tyrobutyricum]MBV4441671.1 hypothetical protein [Clostridium tyrobutyricum]
MREPCEGKLSSTVLRREGTQKGSDLSNTVGKNTKKIKEYIANQLKEDQASEQLAFDMDDPFKGN